MNRLPDTTSSISLIERVVFTISGAIIPGNSTTSLSGSTGSTRGNGSSDSALTMFTFCASAAGAGISAGGGAPFFASLVSSDMFKPA